MIKFLSHKNSTTCEESDRTHLVLPSMLHYLLIHNLIHNLETLDGFLLCDTHISLLQGYRAETTQEKNYLSYQR